LKSLDHFGLLVVFCLRRHSSLFYRRYPSMQIRPGGIAMNYKILGCLIAGALALSSPVLARGGGGGGGGGHGGGMGGGMHGGMGGGMHAMGGGMHFGGMGGGAHFGGARFAGASFAHAAFSPRFSGAAFHHDFHHRFSHNRFHRFAFVGAPYIYAGYDDCWRRLRTSYGPQWVNVCGDYGY